MNTAFCIVTILSHQFLISFSQPGAEIDASTNIFSLDWVLFSRRCLNLMDLLNETIDISDAEGPSGFWWSSVGCLWIDFFLFFYSNISRWILLISVVSLYFFCYLAKLFEVKFIIDEEELTFKVYELLFILSYIIIKALTFFLSLPCLQFFFVLFCRHVINDEKLLLLFVFILKPLVITGWGDLMALLALETIVNLLDRGQDRIGPDGGHHLTCKVLFILILVSNMLQIIEVMIHEIIPFAISLAFDIISTVFFICLFMVARERYERRHRRPSKFLFHIIFNFNQNKESKLF